MFLIALVAVVVVTGLFSVGVRGLAFRTAAREQGASGTAGLAAAVACFVVCAAVVVYGVCLIVAT
ncbi:MAG TPA: hypothetical protein VJ870_11635 [Amycolatopsis sp.]|nr:hypothetical protein [Amycolatopsis sp.]